MAVARSRTASRGVHSALMAEGFVAPDWDAPLDVPGLLAAVPPGRTIKGMFIQAVVSEARSASGASLGRGRYIAFKDYPVKEWIEVLVQAADLIHPYVPKREAVRRLGRSSYPAFASSMLGRVLMSAAGGDLSSALRLVPEIYRYSVGGGSSADLVTLREGYAVIALREVWDFPDARHVGAFEGGIAIFGRVGSVRVRSISLSDVDLEISWT
jgi:uncharacterized protein (TIGR02265 family)